MVKKLAVLFLCICMTLGLAACTGSDDDDLNTEDSLPSEYSAESYADVSMTIPKSAVKICGDFFTDNAARLGINSIQIQGDGSLYFTYKSGAKDTLMRNARVILDDALDSLKTGYRGTEKIEIDRNYSTVTVITDRVTFVKPTDDFFTTAYVPVIACLALSGTSDSEIEDWTLDFVFLDKDTYSIISRYRYPAEEEDTSSSASETNDVNTDGTDDEYTDDYYTDDYYTDSYDSDEYVVYE